MIITKRELKIMKYISKRKSVSYKKLINKFDKYDNLSDTLYSLVYNHYIVQVGGSFNENGEPVPYCPETMFTLDKLGISSVENCTWFDTEYVVSHIVVPIVLSVISTLITLFLSTLLSQFL